jgi:UDP-N-acetylmuramyl pentapeptide phosphotransferase/UDP-N-acetylglucosamine-1-phosphate transferase
MPIRQLALLLGLFYLCLAIVGMAWANGNQLFLFIPSRRPSLPPTHPGVILGFLVLSPTLTYWLRQKGVYFFIALTVGILVGSGMGFYVHNWTPSWAQHFLTVAMIATSIYAWTQKCYFEE